MGLSYRINDIAGETYVWGDLLSRRGSAGASICAIVQLGPVLYLLLDDTFQWPNLTDIKIIQPRYPHPTFSCFEREDGQWRKIETMRIYIPSRATDLCTRLCVAAHTCSSSCECLAAPPQHQITNFRKRCQFSSAHLMNKPAAVIIDSCQAVLKLAVSTSICIT